MSDREIYQGQSVFSGLSLPRFPSVQRYIRRFRASRRMSAADALRLEKQLKDYVGGGNALFGQRQGLYFGACLLAGYYYSIWVALFCFIFIQLTELLDNIISRAVLQWDGGDRKMARRYYFWLWISSVLSASAVSLFACLIAAMEGTSAHFTPLFFLFAAGLFAAVNNHQLPKILVTRLSIYAIIFLFVPAYDIWMVRPPLNSVLWLQFITVLFVLFFVFDCSRIFLKLYRSGLDQLDELRLERDRAQAAYEVKSQFVSIVSHELRTPLTSILGALGLLKSGAYVNAPERAEHVLEIAHKNSERLSSLINDLLDLQKLESKQMTYDLKPLNLAHLVADSVESNTGFAESIDVSLKAVSLDDSLTVLADHDRLLQVLANLLSNAVKFSKSGGVVEVTVAEVGGKARVSIRDYGIGIPEDSRDKVFGKFSQVDSSDHRSFDGTGLGLSITEQIMRAHEGIVDYDSELGKGTTFYFEMALD